MTGIFDGITVEADFSATEQEIRAYIDDVAGRIGNDKKIKTIGLRLGDNDHVTVNYTVSGTPFERIRRITGYLTGTVDRWNNSKKAELHDRVKHA